jgi:hypothetical protein
VVDAEEGVSEVDEFFAQANDLASKAGKVYPRKKHLDVYKRTDG